MDELCTTTHAKLLSGTCPWCGCYIVKGEAKGRLADDPDTHAQDSIAAELTPTLEERVRTDGILSVEEAVHIAVAIAQELALLHQSQTMYGWLIPSNIGIENGAITLRDASAVYKLQGLQVTSGAASGLVDYLAPERALNSFRADPRADLYSLGCVLYFMLVGRAPFAVGSISERLLQHQIEEPQGLAAIREDVPEGLASICSKMLAKKPGDRYQSAEEVVSAIESWEADSR